MGFRDQAAAIPRVWSTATFPTPLFVCPPYRLLATPVAAESTGVVVKILLRIVCRPDPLLDVTTGKNRKPPGNRRKNSSGSDLFSPPLFLRSSLRLRALAHHLGQWSYQPTMISRLASSVSEDFGSFLNFMDSKDTKDVLYIVSSFGLFKRHSVVLTFRCPWDMWDVFLDRQ